MTSTGRATSRDFSRSQQADAFPARREATSEAYVYLKGKQQALLERGPFYAFLLTNGAAIRKGHAVPHGVIRLGVVSIDPYTQVDWFEMRVSFTVPDLPGDFYPIAVCNDPCTTPGLQRARLLRAL